MGDGERIDDVLRIAVAQAARTLAAVFDHQHRHAEECLALIRETGEPIAVSHVIPRSIDDPRRNRAMTRIAEATVGMMGTPDP